jgi:valyl-tRNA synthetase
MAKEKFYNEKDPLVLQTTKYVLLDVMQTAMRLLHPVMPFISEEIWQLIKQIFPLDEEALIIAKFPIPNEEMIDYEIITAMQLMQETITAIRNLRKQINISPALNVDVVFRLANEKQKELFNQYQGYVCKLAKVENITMGVNIDKPASSLVAVVQDLQIFLPLQGLIDIEAEKEKLNKQKEKLATELASIQSKLNNEKFINNAKPEVVAKEKEKESEVSAKFNTVCEALQNLSSTPNS